MRRENILAFLLFLALVSAIGQASASIEVGNLSHSISQKYGTSQNIIGWVNISANNENLNSSFQDSLGKSALLWDVLKQNPGFSYSCIPNGCGNDYSAKNPGTSKTTNAITQLYGMLFSGELTSIDSISLDVSGSSTIPASCSSQFEIDFFNDGISEVSNTDIDSSICPGTKTYGCYSPSSSDSEYSIGSMNSMYCERVTLPKAPGFKIGAWVKKNSGMETIYMELRDSDGNMLKGCILPDTSASGVEVSCSADFPVQKSGDYFVCIYSGQGEGGYSIKGYDNPNGCGVYGIPSPSKEGLAAYSIFAEAKRYAPVSKITIPNSLPSGEKLSNLTKNYLIGKYGSLNCSGDCIVPVNITSSAGSPSLIVNNIKILQQKTTGIVSVSNIYDLDETPGKTSFGFGKLYLDSSGLKSKDSIGNFSYDLSLGGKLIFSSEKLSVLSTPVITGISPSSAAYAFPMTFVVGTDTPKNVSSYEWNFGDNTTKATTPSNNTIHSYQKEGNYTLNVVITDINGIKSSGEFFINVTSPKSLINTTLDKMQRDIAKTKSDISKLDLFKRTGVESVINTTYLSNKITELSKRYNESNESSYSSIVSEIILLKIPESVNSTRKTRDSLLYPDKSIINLAILQEIGGGNYTNDEDYKNAILVWNNQNIKEKIVFDRVYASYPGSTENIMGVFTFTITQESVEYPAYFIMPELENLKFSGSYNEKTTGGYVYIGLKEGQNEIIFSTTEDVVIEDIPAFISPGLSNLAAEGSNPPPTESDQSFNWLLYGLALAALLIAGVIVYLALLFWYKHKYESHLFKNKNDLYNIYSFINTQKKKGVTEKEVISKLRNAGWNSEQVRYVIRKYSGRNTGMPLSELMRESKKEERREER